jgi:hypothetical protein
MTLKELYSFVEGTKTAISVVIIGHLNKNESSKDLYRGLGSIDIATSVRSVIQVDYR